MAARRSEIESRTSEPVLPGTNRILQDDVTFVEVPNQLDIGSKATWLLNNTSLLGNRIVENGERGIRFDSKPFRHLALHGDDIVNPRNTSPVNIYTRPIQGESRQSDAIKEIFDPIRWVSDKTWFNSRHVDGPVDFETVAIARQAHRKSEVSEFYYINKESPAPLMNSIIADEITHHPDDLKPWGVFYRDTEKQAFFVSVSNPRHAPGTWRNSELASRIMNLNNHLLHDIRYENHALMCNTLNKNRWNWPDYFYGFVPEVILKTIEEAGANRVPELGSVYMFLARQGSSDPASPYYWKSMYAIVEYLIERGLIAQTYSQVSLNLHPVFPFFSARYFRENEQRQKFLQYSTAFYAGSGLNQPEQQRRLLAPPEMGRELFYDHNTKVVDLMSKEESEIVDIGSKAYYDIRPVYSYYDCLYEKIFSPNLLETELPSPYLPFASPEISTRIQNIGFDPDGVTVEARDYERLDDFLFSRLLAADSYFELGNFPQESISSITPTAASFQIEGILERDQQAIREFAQYMKNEGFYNFNLNSAEPNTYLSLYDTETLDQIYEMRRMYPMFVEIELGHINKSAMAEALTFDGDNSLVKYLFSSVLESSEPNENEESYSYVEQITQNIFTAERNAIAGIGELPIIEPGGGFNFGQRASDSSGQSPSGTRVSDTIPVQIGSVLNFSEWWKNTFDNIMEAQSDEDNFVSPLERFANVLRLITLRLRAKNLIDSKTRNYREVMNGVPAENEVLGFIIQKFAVNSETGELTEIGNFQILSNNDREVERFIDTQVKYGEIYEYRIHRVALVYGNKYCYLDNIPVEERIQNINVSYDASGAPRVAPFYMPFGIANLPDVRVMILPTETKRISVVDKPPIFPNVEFVPFRNNQREIAIAMTSNTGDFSAPPVILEEDDKVQFLRVALSQGVPGVQDLLPENMNIFDFQLNGELSEHIKTIKFRSDDPATKFEIFRLDHYPASILDFRQGRKIKINKKSDSCLYKDRLMPDKKYYYVFRVEDIHGHVSNPTEIFEVILKTYDESVRMEVKVVKPENVLEKERIRQESSMNFRQFVYLRPTIRHRAANMVESGRYSDFENLGPNSMLGEGMEKKVWNREFILRIRSLNTGKEIDVNFKFVPKLNVLKNKKENLIC